MTGEEFLFLSQYSKGAFEEKKESILDEKYVYGLAWIADIFNCSITTVNRIKQSGKIDKAITQVGKNIIVDAKLTFELTGRKTSNNISILKSFELINHEYVRKLYLYCVNKTLVASELR